MVAQLNSNRLCVSYELWHSRLGHVSFSTISLLYKHGNLFVTSLLPKPGVYSSCEISKSHELLFPLNEKQSLHVLNMIHCDLWDPLTVCFIYIWLYEFFFADEFSPFTWFYPLKHKSDFAIVLKFFWHLFKLNFLARVRDVINYHKIKLGLHV